MRTFNHATHLTLALSSGDVAEIHSAVAELYEADLDRTTCEVLALLWKRREEANPEGVGNGGDSASIWVKTRLHERGKLPCGPFTDLSVESTYNDLHCFFLSIQETAAQLGRLHNEHLKAEDEVGPARSQIAAEVEVIQPIDRVAQRVTGWKDEP